MAPRVPTLALQSCTAVVFATLVSACNGTIGDTGKGSAGETGWSVGTGTPTCTAPCDSTDPATATPGALRIWRLTNQQYDNTVRDLLGDDTAPAESFIRDIGGAGFANNAALLGVSDEQAAAYRTAATKLASDAVAKRLDSIFPCGAAKVDDPMCAKQFVQSFGKRAFRRPLTDLETQAYFDFYTATKASLDAKTASAGGDTLGDLHYFNGWPDNYHSTGHAAGGTQDGVSRSQAESLETMTQISVYYAKMLAELIDLLKATPEADGSGTLFDNTLIYWSAEMAHGNHGTFNIPHVIIGGKWHFATGRFLSLPSPEQYKDVADNKFGDILIAVANAMGHPITKFGRADWCGTPDNVARIRGV